MSSSGDQVIVYSDLGVCMVFLLMLAFVSRVSLMCDRSGYSFDVGSPTITE